MKRRAMSKLEARSRARQRMAELLAREDEFLGLAAEWELAQDHLQRTLAGMYGLGFSRSEIAERLGTAVSVVPRQQEVSFLTAVGGEDDRAQDTNSESAAEGCFEHVSP